MRVLEPQSTEEWEQYYDVRFRILREPWGAEKGSERDPGDAVSINLMLVDDHNTPLSVGRLHFNSATESQVRYMAVETQMQGRGLGRRMMQALEQRARQGGASIMILEARESAIAFYEGLGYKVDKMSYLLFNEIQHFTMSKAL